MNIDCYQSPTDKNFFCAEVSTKLGNTIEMFTLSIPYGFRFFKCNATDPRDIHLPFIPGKTVYRFLFCRTDDVPEKDQISPYLSYQYNQYFDYEPPEYEDSDEDEIPEFTIKPFRYSKMEFYFTLATSNIISPIVDEEMKRLETN
jgi:hypothetical protein